MNFIKKLSLVCAVFLYTTIVSCQVDKRDLRGHDFKLFADTKAWNLAKAVQHQDMAEIDKQIKGNKISVDFEEDIYGQSLLQLAVQNELLNSSQKLLSLGANPNHTDSFNGNSPMHNCAGIRYSKDDTTLLALLIGYGGNPNGLSAITNGPGKGAEKSVLMVACSNNLATYNRVKYLVEKGADVNYINSAGRTILFECFISENYDVILYLLKNGKLNYKGVVFTDFSGHENYIQDLMRSDFIELDTPQYGYKLEVIEFLKHNGIDYKSTPIPERIKTRAKETYPDSWEDYLSKY
jgi:uncharacterized protein